MGGLQQLVFPKRRGKQYQQSMSELRKISGEVLEELATDSEIANRIAVSVKAFQEQATAYHAISEEAYYDARKQ